jgi:serine/threonine-protein kinase
VDDVLTTEVEKQEAASWFRGQVSTLLRLDHPNIPKCRAHWTETVTSGPYYLAMEFIHGQTLEQILDEKGQIDWRQAAEWGLSISKALAYLHEQTPPYLFRDLKPANIMIEAATNAPKLIAFGIARRFTRRAGQTPTSNPGYAPMEQWLGRTEPRSDVYALGAVLHALVSGRRPHAELARLQDGGLDLPAAMQQLFPPLDTLVPGLPPAFVQAVARAVAFDAADRFPDATAFGAALGEALVESTARAVAERQPRGSAAVLLLPYLWPAPTASKPLALPFIIAVALSISALPMLAAIIGDLTSASGWCAGPERAWAWSLGQRRGDGDQCPLDAPPALRETGVPWVV